MYASYAVEYRAYFNIPLISLAVFVGAFIPYYSRISNRVEERVNLRTALITIGRLFRFTLQLAFNALIFVILTLGKVLPVANLDDLGGVMGVALLTTCASQGMQYVALSLANRELGDKNRNVLIALSINIVVTALATMGATWAKDVFRVCGFCFGALFFTIGLLSDGRAFLFPRRGVGVFLGTFNPIHHTHLTLIREAVKARGLRKVYLHCTTVPKLHVEALERGEIQIARRERGMRVYEKTPRCDVHVNYFPTGNRFYEYEDRLSMMRLAILDAGMADVVEVLSLPQDYDHGGFYAVLRRVKALAPGEPVHGIHGSDLGGMWVRNIYDESGWVYPYPVVRKDSVSATAIRNGARGLTTVSVERAIELLGEGASTLEFAAAQGGAIDAIDTAARARHAGKAATGLVRVKIVETESERLKAMLVRGIVYMHEQGCPFREEFDLNDHTCTQVIGQIDDEPVLTARIRYFNGFAKLERLAVRPEHRGSGYGHQLLGFLLAVCRQKGFSTFYLHAQKRFQGFYEHHGFRAVGTDFSFSDYSYVEMVRNDERMGRQPQQGIGSQPMILNRPENNPVAPGPLENPHPSATTNPGVSPCQNPHLSSF
jgi:predicted GNAT family N-acyltransferase/nicotinic acid mononucleotide adenylyltransferase